MTNFNTKEFFKWVFNSKQQKSELPFLIIFHIIYIPIFYVSLIKWNFISFLLDQNEPVLDRWFTAITLIPTLTAPAMLWAERIQVYLRLKKIGEPLN
jgi:glutathione peroxidase-family protein